MDLAPASAPRWDRRRLATARGLAPLADDLHLESGLAPARYAGTYPSAIEEPHTMAVGARSHPADRPAVVEYGLIADGIRVRRFDR